MHPIFDMDVILLMATTLSSKRRPADLLEIVAATQLIQGYAPDEGRLLGAFQRLSSHGLIVAEANGYRLTPPAEAIMATLPRKCETAERIIRIKEELSAYQAAEKIAPLDIEEEQIIAAIQAHKAAEAIAAKNMPPPNPRAADPDAKRPGQWRKFSDTRRRKG